jgi:glycosyltransferase involved in cell wall biosynthesis
MPGALPDSTRSIKVCHIAAATGGAYWMVDQLRELRDRYGYEVSAVIAGDNGDLARNLVSEGIPFQSQPLIFGRLRSLLRLPFIVFGLAALLKRQQIDVVQTHLFHSMMLGRMAAWLAGVPVRLSMIPGPFHLEARTTRWMDIATSWMDTSVIASCEYTRALYRRFGVPDDQLALIYYGPAAERFDPTKTEASDLRSEFRLPDQSPLIGMVANFYASGGRKGMTPSRLQRLSIKGHEHLIRAAPRILEEFPRARFLLVGKAWDALGLEHMQAMRRLVQQLGLQDKVLFAGYRPDVASVLKSLDVSVQASNSENLGGTIESLLMERPTVATRVGGMPDAVRDGETGLLAKPADPDDLARAVRALLRDRDHATRLARNGRSLMLQRFTLSRTASDLDELYRSQLAARGRPACSQASITLLRLAILAWVGAYLVCRLFIEEILTR